MKKVFLYSVILLATVACAQKTSELQKNLGNFEKIDSSFNHHFKILDTYITDRSSDSSVRRMTSIYFMETTTGLNASGSMTYAGKYSFTKENVEAWHKWYNENKDKLVWDPKTKTVWRRKE